MLLLSIAARNVFRQKRRSLLLMAAIAFGAFSITLLDGFTAGIEQNAKENLSNLYGGHLYIRGVETLSSGTRISVIRDEKPLLAALKASRIETASIVKRTSIRGSLIMGTRETPIAIAGVDWESENLLKERLPLLSGSLEDTGTPDSIVIPERVARKLKAEVGDEVLARMTTVTNQNNVVSFRVVGIVKDTSDFAEALAYAELSYTAEALNLKKGEFQSMNILLQDIGSTDADADTLYIELARNLKMIARQPASAKTGDTGTDAAPAPDSAQASSKPLAGMMRGGMMGSKGGSMGMSVDHAPPAGAEEIGKSTYALTTINDMMKTVKTLLDMLDTVGKAVFTVLLAIIMVGIGNTFRIMLLERIKEIGTMRALGMQKDEVLRIFMYEALLLAVAGSFAGIVASGILGLAAQLFPIDGISSLFLNRGRLSYVVNLALMLTACGSLILLSLAASLGPSRQASRLEPAEALRSNK